MQKRMLIRLCGVKIYEGNFAPLTVHTVDMQGDEHPLFIFDPDGVRVRGEDLVRVIEEMTKNGALRVHPRSIEEF